MEVYKTVDGGNKQVSRSYFLFLPNIRTGNSPNEIESWGGKKLRQTAGNREVYFTPCIIQILEFTTASCNVGYQLSSFQTKTKNKNGLDHFNGSHCDSWLLALRIVG